MDILSEALSLRLALTEKSLEFLSEGCSAYETRGAINSDLIKLYNLRKQVDKLQESVSSCQLNLQVADRVQLAVRDANLQTDRLTENLATVKFPEAIKPVVAVSRAEKQAVVEQKSDQFPEAKQQQQQNARKQQATTVAVPKLQYLTVQEFGGVPKYMKGRYTYDSVNQAIDEFNEAVQNKYTFLRRGFQAMGSMQDKKRFKEWRSHETKETRGRFFVVGEDLREQPTLKSEANRQKIFTILRHTARIQENRGPGPILRYCVRDNGGAFHSNAKGMRL